MLQLIAAGGDQTQSLPVLPLNLHKCANAVDKQSQRQQPENFFCQGLWACLFVCLLMCMDVWVARIYVHHMGAVFPEARESIESPRIKITDTGAGNRTQILWENNYCS